MQEKFNFRLSENKVSKAATWNWKLCTRDLACNYHQPSSQSPRNNTGTPSCTKKQAKQKNTTLIAFTPSPLFKIGFTKIRGMNQSAIKLSTTTHVYAHRNTMAGKRKRTRPNAQEGGQKRQKISDPLQSSKDPIIKHALLAQYYPQVFTLREYLLRRLPNTSKIRRKKIASVGRNPSAEHRELEEELARFLDQTLVGESVCLEVSKQERWSQWISFSQKVDDSVSTLVNLSSPGVYSQSEVCFPVRFTTRTDRI